MRQISRNLQIHSNGRFSHENKPFCLVSQADHHIGIWHIAQKTGIFVGEVVGCLESLPKKMVDLRNKKLGGQVWFFQTCLKTSSNGFKFFDDLCMSINHHAYDPMSYAHGKINQINHLKKKSTPMNFRPAPLRTRSPRTSELVRLPCSDLPLVVAPVTVRGSPGAGLFTILKGFSSPNGLRQYVINTYHFDSFGFLLFRLCFVTFEKHQRNTKQLCLFEVSLPHCRVEVFSMQLVVEHLQLLLDCAWILVAEIG